MPAELMLVADAPGFHDDRLGRPLVAAAGELLSDLLASIGLERRDVYVTTLVKCRPPGTQSPAPEEIAACRDKLERQIELVRPRVVGALGDLATRALAGGGTWRLADARAGAARRRSRAARSRCCRSTTRPRPCTTRASCRRSRPMSGGSVSCSVARPSRAAPEQPAPAPARAVPADEQQLGLF